MFCGATKRVDRSLADGRSGGAGLGHRPGEQVEAELTAFIEKRDE